MSAQEQVQSVTLEAGADLSADQFKFVLVAADGQIDLVGAAGGDVDGVLLNDPSAVGQAATMQYAGRAKVVIGVGDIVAGDLVQSDALGLAILGTTGDHILGKCLVGGAAGELCEMLFNPRGIL
jgi:hypothetical protein